MTTRSRKASGNSGFTLVEFLVAMAILAMVSVMVASAVFAAQAGTKRALKWGDSAEQLRMALNQMGEDVTLGHWCCVSVSAGTGDTVMLAGYQIPQVDRTGWDPAWADWPGYFQVARSVLVQYRLEGDQLIRVVYDGASYDWDPAKSAASKAYVRQVLASGLNPYVSVGHATGSYFEVDDIQHIIRVVLRSTRGEAGVNNIEEASARWFVPAMQ